MLNEIPVEYFSSLDQNGRRRDADERPELSQGTVEYVAPADYMVGRCYIHDYDYLGRSEVVARNSSGGDYIHDRRESSEVVARNIGTAAALPMAVESREGGGVEG